jgi:hypothetical protein
VSIKDATKPERVHQGERFLEAARTLGGGASAEEFAELVKTIAAARRAARGENAEKTKRRLSDRSSSGSDAAPDDDDALAQRLT